RETRTIYVRNAPLLQPDTRRYQLNMTKAELIDAVAKSADVSKADAERTVGAFFDIVAGAAKTGDKVAWPGFGSFSTSRSQARTCRDPDTGTGVELCDS